MVSAYRRELLYGSPDTVDWSQYVSSYLRSRELMRDRIRAWRHFRRGVLLSREKIEAIVRLPQGLRVVNSFLHPLRVVRWMILDAWMRLRSVGTSKEPGGTDEW